MTKPLFSQDPPLRFFRRNRKREQSENKPNCKQNMCTENTNCVFRKHVYNIIIYSPEIGQYIMWITRQGQESHTPYVLILL